jgi:hypothetical protein
MLLLPGRGQDCRENAYHGNARNNVSRIDMVMIVPTVVATPPAAVIIVRESWGDRT